MRRKITVLLVAMALGGAPIIGCGTDGGDTGEPEPTARVADASFAPPPGAPNPEPGADLPVGTVIDDSIIIANGRLITPQGNQLASPRFVTKIVTSPDGEYAYYVSMADRRVVALDLDTLTVSDTLILDGAFNGLVLNAAGDKMWVGGGGANDVFEIEVTGGELTLSNTIQLYGYPTAVVLSPDEQTLYVAVMWGRELYAIDTVTGSVIRRWTTGLFPYDIALNASGSRAYVTNIGGESVTVVNTNTSQVVDTISVGKNPEGIIFHNGKVYVASADADTVSIIDPADNTVTEVIDLGGPDEYFGYFPTHMALDGDLLYVACSGQNAIAVIDTTTDTLEAFIPTAWYPTAVGVDEASGTIIVANGRGTGTGPGDDEDSQSSLSVFDRPATEDYAALSATVYENNQRTAKFYLDLDFESPIPTERGVPSEQIKRVIFVMKENKTYDQVFGDVPGTEGDPELCIYCGDPTRNFRALAQQFVNCDNFYAEGEASLMGHLWATSLVCNDFMEKAHKVRGWPGEIGEVEAAGQAASGNIFEHLLDAGIEFRSYGQVVNTITNMERLFPYVSIRYGFYNQGVPDEKKIDIVINEMKAGIWPPFVYISIPNDHTNGTDPGSPTPDYMVADNDAALGKLVDYVSHSEHWNETAIFIMEDDPQSGADHVDTHRSPGVVVSPWAKRGYVSHTLYTMSSMWLTIEHIFGIDSMTDYDEDMAPMYDCFTMTPDYTPYDALPRVIPLEYNPAGGPMADWSSKQIWDVPDQVPNMGEIIWALKKPGVPFPFHLSVDYRPDNMDGEDEGEEEEIEHDVAAYRAAVKRWTDFALSKGIEPISVGFGESE